MMSIVTLAGAVAFITSIIGLLPQIIKSFKTKSTEDISMLMVLNYLICSLAWIIYSLCTASWVVFASNVVGFMSGLILVFQKKYYDIKNEYSHQGRNAKYFSE